MCGKAGGVIGGEAGVAVGESSQGDGQRGYRVTKETKSFISTQSIAYLYNDCSL